MIGIKRWKLEYNSKMKCIYKNGQNAFENRMSHVKMFIQNKV